MAKRATKLLIDAGLPAKLQIESKLHKDRSEVNLQESHLPHTTPYEFTDAKNWGTLRPHLYFGLKTKHIESPLFGLIWYKQPKDGEDVVLRHWCGNRDPVVFLWHDHDGKSFGTQRIKDDNLTFNTNWFNTSGNSCLVNLDIFSRNENVSGFKIGEDDTADTDGIVGGDADRRDDNCYAFIFYFALQTSETYLKPSIVPKNGKLRAIEWESKEFGKLSMTIRANSLKSESNFSHLFKRSEPHMDMTTVDDLIRESLELGKNGFKRLRFEEDGMMNPNFAAIQILVRDGETIDVRLQSNDEQLPADFAAEFDPKIQEFRKTFDSVFPVNNIENPELYAKVARHALSNLLGGIGFWHGDTPCLLHTGDIKNYGPLNLFASVPSRPYFPRGFLWDEGFHQLLIRHMDPNLSMEIVGSWLDTMNEQGWIPREQALDTEAKARFPPGFWMESDVANPPMFFYLMDKYLKNPELRENFADRIRLMYPKLKKLYLWLRRTQEGPLPGSFQWQGRGNAKELNPATLPSGFDDLPRASHPSPEEYHVDIRCWMAFSSKVLHELALLADDTEWLAEIQNDILYMNDLETLDALHWSEEKQQYCDFGLHSLDLKMITKEMPDGSEIMVREVGDSPQLRLIDDVNGYANLFPFLMKMLPPESNKLEPILRSIKDPEDFWTPYGLRSLTTRGPYYNAWNNKTAYPYWRGPIWINMNYFALEALEHYTKLSERYGQLCAEIYKELRLNVLGNIVKQYEETGFFWEHYSDLTGVGHGTRPFTGWTTLFVLILAEKYD